MKFEETKDVITIEKYQNVFIYFLLSKSEVMYVGQTKQGIVRPMSHKDKCFDEIKIIYCKENELDLLEDLYIKKYKPYYNKAVNYSMNYSLSRTRNKIREHFNDKVFNLTRLKKIIKLLNIQVYSHDITLYISVDDYKRIIDYIEETGNFINV